MNNEKIYKPRHFGVSPNSKPRPIEILGHLLEPEENNDCIDIPDSYYPIKLESPVRINRYRDWMAESDNNSSIEFLYVDGSAQTIRKQMVSGGSQTKPVLCVPLIRKNPALGSIEIVTTASSVSDFDTASTSSASDGYLTSHEEDKDPKEEECDRNCFRRIKKSAYTLIDETVALKYIGITLTLSVLVLAGFTNRLPLMEKLSDCTSYLVCETTAEENTTSDLETNSSSLGADLWKIAGNITYNVFLKWFSFFYPSSAV